MRHPPDEPTQDDLLELVAAALDRLDLDGSQDAILEGVRRALDAANDREGPDLRVVDTEEVERIHREEAEPRVKVHVVKPSRRVAPLGEGGRIRVTAGAEPTAWQTVVRATEARAYRLACDAGTLQIAVDGVPVELLTEGQTVDVEARLIRVCAYGATAATGRYHRL